MIDHLLNLTIDIKMNFFHLTLNLIPIYTLLCATGKVSKFSYFLKMNGPYLSFRSKTRFWGQSDKHLRSL